MKRISPVFYVCLLLLSEVSSAQEKSSIPSGQTATDVKEPRNAESSAKLPVRRVVLYKNGVCYFEHLGHVRGSQDVHVDFTSAQLNDVLKSLTVLDLSGGRHTRVGPKSPTAPPRRPP